MIRKEDFIKAVIRIARQKGYTIETNARTGEEQIDFGHKKLHAGHLCRLYPSALAENANITDLIENVAPGRNCTHRPMREIIRQLRGELGG